MRPPGKINIQAKGFAAFARIQGKGGDMTPDKGIKQIADGRWYGWQKHPHYKTDLFATRAEAKEALFRDAPKVR